MKAITIFILVLLQSAIFAHAHSPLPLHLSLFQCSNSRRGSGLFPAIFTAQTGSFFQLSVDGFTATFQPQHFTYGKKVAAQYRKNCVYSTAPVNLPFSDAATVSLCRKNIIEGTTYWSMQGSSTFKCQVDPAQFAAIQQWLQSLYPSYSRPQADLRLKVALVADSNWGSVLDLDTFLFHALAATSHTSLYLNRAFAKYVQDGKADWNYLSIEIENIEFAPAVTLVNHSDLAGHVSPAIISSMDKALDQYFKYNRTRFDGLHVVSFVAPPFSKPFNMDSPKSGNPLGLKWSITAEYFMEAAATQGSTVFFQSFRSHITQGLGLSVPMTDGTQLTDAQLDELLLVLNPLAKRTRYLNKNEPSCVKVATEDDQFI